MKVTHLIMGGSSQTGGTTLGYIRSAHAGARMADGSPVFDGYFPTLAGGTEPVSGGDAAVVHALGEGDIMGGRPIGYRRPDSDEPDDRFRLFEIVAASHVPTRGYESAAEIFPLLADADPASGELSQFPAAMPYMAAMHNLIEWVTEGTAPPKADRIETDANGEIVRDRVRQRSGRRASELRRRPLRDLHRKLARRHHVPEDDRSPGSVLEGATRRAVPDPRRLRRQGQRVRRGACA